MFVHQTPRSRFTLYNQLLSRVKACQHFISDWLRKLKPNKLSTGCHWNELKGMTVEKATNAGRQFLFFSLVCMYVVHVFMALSLSSARDKTATLCRLTWKSLYSMDTTVKAWIILFITYSFRFTMSVIRWIEYCQMQAMSGWDFSVLICLLVFSVMHNSMIFSKFPLSMILQFGLDCEQLSFAQKSESKW